MIKPILLAILIIFLSLVFSPIANATGEVTLGCKIDDGDLSIVTSVDHSWQGKRFINDVEFDYRYKDSNNVKKTNRGLIAFKQRYELQSRHYLFSYLDLIIMNLDQLIQEYKVPMVGDIRSLKQKNLK